MADQAPASDDPYKPIRDKLSKIVDHFESEEMKKRIEATRGLLMVLATLAVSIVYQAGLNPPGGFWQDDGNGHTAGTPVLHDKNRARYLTFYYCNAMAFVMSLVIIVLLMEKKASVQVLVIITMLDFMSLVAAYIAGSASDLVSSIVLVVGSFLVFLYLARWILVHIGKMLLYGCLFILFGLQYVLCCNIPATYIMSKMQV